MPVDVWGRNHVRVTGEGPRHGFGCDQNMWRFVAPAFTRDYRGVLFDDVGSGRSDLRAYSPGRDADPRGYAQDVLEICEALDLRADPVIARRFARVTFFSDSRRDLAPRA